MYITQPPQITCTPGIYFRDLCLHYMHIREFKENSYISDVDFVIILSVDLHRDVILHSYL